MSALKFQTDFVAQVGAAISLAPGIVRVTADNASPYTYTGTNSYILGHDRVAIVDPGPVSPAHRQALIDAVVGRPVSHILLTHTHKDHSESAAELAAHFGAAIAMHGPHRLMRTLHAGEENPYHHAGDWDLLPDVDLAHGQKLTVGDIEIAVWATPGHCANHACFEIVDTPYIVTGDLIMGWSTTLIAPPDGSLAAYFSSLALMEGLNGDCYLTGHGGQVRDGKPYIAGLRAHREKRSVAITAAVARGCATIAALRAVIYPTLNANLIGAAESTLLGHLEYLDATGEIKLVFNADAGYRFSAR